MSLMLARASARQHSPALLAAARQLSSSPAAPLADRGMRDSQDPSKTWQAYSAPKPGEERHVPGAEDAEAGEPGTERAVKWGENIPASAEPAKEELKYAGKGLAQSVEQAVGVLASKGRDAVAAAQRAVGMGSDRVEMSSGTMGAAGKMEHAPPGVKSGGISGTPENADAKYREIADIEKPHWPEGERTVQDRFPDMATAAGEQSNTPEGQWEENERIRRELHKPS